MFDEFQPNEKARRSGLSLIDPVKVIACAAGGLLLSLGLCGANLAIREKIHYGEGVLGASGLVLFALSICSLIGGILWFIGAAILNAVRRPGSKNDRNL